MSRHEDGSPVRPPESGGDPQALPAQRRSESVAERIRRKAQGPRSTCVRPDVLEPDGRCQRCYGLPEEGAS